jgi:protein-S-isoprenylcysteine O-methyltransferase Ste14
MSNVDCFVCLRSVSCVLCPMLTVLFVFVLCLVFYVQCWLFCLSSFCVLCPIIGHRTQDTERKQTKQSTLDIGHKTQNEDKQNSQHWTYDTRHRTKTNKTVNVDCFVCLSSFCVLCPTSNADCFICLRSVSCFLCPMLIVLFVFVLCLVSYVQCYTERRQTKQSTLDIEHKTQNEDKQNNKHWT